MSTGNISYEVEPSPQAEEAVAVSQTSALETDFSELSSLVEKRGDVLDRLPLLRRSAAVGSVALAGAGATGMFLGIWSGGSSLHLANFARFAYPLANIEVGMLAAVTAGAAKAAAPLARQYHARKPQELLQKQRHIAGEYFGGEPVELYRSRPKGRKSQMLELFWHGPEDDVTLSSTELHERLSTLARGMEATKATWLLMPRGIINEYVDEDLDKENNAEPDESQIYVTTTNEFLAYSKKTHTRDMQRGDQDIVVLGKDALADILENVETAEREEPLHSIMQTLRQVRPDHMLLSQYRIGIKEDLHDSKRFEQSIRRQMEYRLHDSTRKLQVIDESEPWLRVGQRADLMGKVRISRDNEPKIRWQQPGRPGNGDEQDLLAYFRTSEAELVDLPRNFAKLPMHRVVQLCELAALLCMHDKIVPSNADEGAQISTGSARAVDDKQHDYRGLQERIAERTLLPRSKQPEDVAEKSGISTRYNRWQRLGRASRRVGASALLGIVVGGGIISQYNHDSKETALATDKAVGEIMIGANSPSIEEWQAYQEALFDNPLDNTLGFFVDAQDKVSDVLLLPIQKLALAATGQMSKSEHDQIESDQQQENEQSTGIGNSPNTPNRAVWQLEPKGMSSEGLWMDSTYQDVLIGNMTWSKYDRLKAQPLAYDTYGDVPANEIEPYVLEEFNAMPALQNPESVESSGHFIKVSRTVLLDDDWDDLTGNGHIRKIAVPVLQGTKVAAARFDGGGDIKVQILDDGTTTLLIPASDASSSVGKLEYWVVLDGNASKVKATEKVHDLSGADDNAMLDDVWEKYGVPESVSAEKRIEAQEHVLQGMQYTLKPFPNQYNGSDSAAEFVETVLKGNKALCNVAATALVVSNPELLNYATGYNNNNTPQQESNGIEFLSSSEAHAVAVDSKGNVYDATPTSGVPEDEKEHFSEENLEPPADPRENRAQIFKVGSLAVGGVLGGALLFGQRRRIRKAALATKRAGAHALLSRISREDIATAHDTYFATVYGSAPVTKVVNLESDKTVADYIAGLKAVVDVDPDGHGQVSEHLVGASPDVRKAIKRAQRIIKLAARAKPVDLANRK